MAILQSDASGVALTDNNGKELVRTSGSVLQVVSQTTTNPASFTSSNFASTNLFANITPRATSSKVLIIVSGSIRSSTSGSSHGILTIFRGSVNLGNTTWGFGNVFTLDTQFESFASLSYLDSPNTTSNTQYVVALRRFTGGTDPVIFPAGSGRVGSIVLLEIAG